MRMSDRSDLPTQFAWAVLGLGDYPPPAPRRGPQYGPDATCWLCGGPTHGVGWPWLSAIPDTFTNHTLAACPTSTTICQPCVGLGSKATWERYATDHPELRLKTGHAMSWRCYSHLFTSAPPHHECPTRARWREILLSPPDPPFLAVVAESGQKHLIFRGVVAHSRDRFMVQFEEHRVWLDRGQFGECLVDFERLYNLGFSKASILSCRYHHGQMLKVGLGPWREAESDFAPWRRLPYLAGLAGFVARKSEMTPATPMESPVPTREDVPTCCTDSTARTASQPRLL